MDSDVDALILSVLSHERRPSLPRIDGHPDKDTSTPNPTTLSVNGSKYHVVSSTVDILLQNKGSSLQAARIILAVRKAAATEQSPLNTPDTEATVQPVTQIAAHTFSRPQETPTTTTTIIDTDALQASPRPTSALRASAIPVHPTRPATRGPSLGDTYHAYIATINAGGPAMTSRLAGFCHSVVTHNGRPLSLPRYQRLMEDAQGAIPDITFHVADLIADEERQMVAARLRFTGTPVKTWQGVEPKGDPVDFSEQVFYWFQEGKIRSVVSVVDMQAYREQMRT